MRPERHPHGDPLRNTPEQTIARAGLCALAVVAVLVACSGRAVLPQANNTETFSSGENWASALEEPAKAGKARLPVTLTVVRPAFPVRTLTLYAYTLTPTGPLATPPPKSLAGTFDVSARSPYCKKFSRGRTCSFRVPVPRGSDAIVATVSTLAKVVGQSLVVVDAKPGASLAMIAGDVKPTQLRLTIPALRARAFNIAATAWLNFTTAVLTDPAKSIVVQIYGPSGTVPSPRATVGGPGIVAPFAWNGKRFVNPLTVAAILRKLSITGQVFPPSTPVPMCRILGNTQSLMVPESTVLSPPPAGGFFLGVSVAGSTPVQAQLDTGSTSLLLSMDNIVGPNAKQFIGPGEAGSETLEPHNVTLSGHYYLAPVTLSNNEHTSLGTTVPMEIFVPETACSPGPNGSTVCRPDTGTSYVGVGFGRPSPQPTNGFLKDPTENAFLQLQSVVVNQNMHPGFILSNGSLTIGLNASNAQGFSYTPLAAFPGRPGDWQGPPACLVFNNNPADLQCGNMLVDVGISSMFISAPTPRPVDEIQVVSPSLARPLLNYSFPYTVPPSATPPAPDPKASHPVTFESYPPIFVNTGRYVLGATDYLYDEACGRVGFRAVSP